MTATVIFHEGHQVGKTAFVWFAKACDRQGLAGQAGIPVILRIFCV